MDAMAVMEIICDKIFYSDLTAKVAKFFVKGGLNTIDYLLTINPKYYFTKIPKGHPKIHEEKLDSLVLNSKKIAKLCQFFAFI